MEIGAILLVLALLVGAGFFVLTPFLEPRRSMSLSASDQELSTLMAERDRLINALQDLDFDYKLGKIPAEAYPGQREELLKRGADVLRRIDALSGPLEGDTDREAEARIEAVVAARRADAAGMLPRRCWWMMRSNHESRPGGPNARNIREDSAQIVANLR